MIDACDKGSIPGQIFHVISNRKDAYGLKRAQSSTPPIASLVHSLYGYKKRNPDDVPLARGKFNDKLAALIQDDKPDLIVCAGYMHVLTGGFLAPMAEAGIPVINL